jgi:hypothetical protein
LIWKIYLIIVKVDDDVQLGFWEIKEKRVCRTGKDAFALVQHVYVLEGEKGNKKSLRVVNLEGQTILSQGS